MSYTHCKICNNYLDSTCNRKEGFCNKCDFDFRKFIVLYSRLIEKILEFYFGDVKTTT